MSRTDSRTYDAAIIGAGIGGLVCGCYLAKAGMKVLIAEQHHQPGGYCSSFRRNGYLFDAAAHSFGGYREQGLVRTVFKELKIDERLAIERYDPTDTIITPEGMVSFHGDVRKTIESFQKAYPAEAANIERFFYAMVSPTPGFYARTRNRTFKQLLDKYFTNEKIKAVVSYPLYGNSGLPPSSLSALIGAKVFLEFLIDGGYYPRAGMQALSNNLAGRFMELGGDLRLSCRVKKIAQENGRISGIMMAEHQFVPAARIISNADARQTFNELLDNQVVPEEFRQRLKTMTPSLSMFILYLGLDGERVHLAEPGVNTWLLPHYDLDALYGEAQSGQQGTIIMVRVMPDKRSMIAFAPASFQDREYWAANKAKLMDYYLAEIDKRFLPELARHIVYKEAATPATLFRYTSNAQGASYGWAPTPDQLAVPDFKKPSFVRGLHLSGHWATQGIGIPGVVYVGYDTARVILKQYKPGQIMVN
jgi:phytoene dehydrogenase-like protein